MRAKERYGLLRDATVWMSQFGEQLHLSHKRRVGRRGGCILAAFVAVYAAAARTREQAPPHGAPCLRPVAEPTAEATIGRRRGEHLHRNLRETRRMARQRAATWCTSARTRDPLHCAS